MNKATLQCIWMDRVTLWELKLWFDHPKVFMIAPPWKDNKPNISCIPQGLYNVTRGNTSQHKDVFKVLNVPNRSGVLIHPGNYGCDVVIGNLTHKSDSLGCYLPGFDYNKTTPMVKSSVKAMDWLRDHIHENFALEVRFMYPPD